MSEELNADESSRPIEESVNLPDELAELVGDLSEEQRELLNLLLQEQGIDLNSSHIVPLARSVDEDGILWHMPLSFAQQRLWFLDQLEPESSLYNLLTIVRLNGELHIPVLKQCVEEIIRRHEILRTTFQAKDGQPHQIIAPEMPFILPEIDLRNLPQSEQNIEVMRQAAQEARVPFNLTNGPLLRVLLLRLTSTENVLIVNVHHIIADGWSVNVLIFEMALLYEAFETGKPSPLAPLPIQYADFAVWQRNYLQGPVLEKQLDYWLETLADSQPILNLPKDYPLGVRPGPTDKNSGKSYQFSLPDDLYRKLLDFSQREGATLFMTLLASFQVLLYRYSGQSDFNIGVPMANRTRAEIENLIGFFVNTLVLRAKLSPDLSFREFLEKVKEHTLEAFANQDLPFEVLVEKLDLERNTGTSPLFQVMFALQNATRQNKKIPGLTLNVLPLESETAKFDLSLVMLEDAGQLNGAIEYRSNLYDPLTIELLIRHYLILLSTIVNNPDEKVSSLKILGNDEIRQLTINWNNTETLFESGRCIHELFEEQVRIHPDSTALIFNSGSDDEDQQLTYVELDRRSNLLAAYLKQKGVGPEILVGVLVNRSIEMIVAILGILKSGGAYLPLDPNYPVERLRFMIEDSQVQFLVAQEQALQKFTLNSSKGLTTNHDFYPPVTDDTITTASGVPPLQRILVIQIDRDWQEIEHALENRAARTEQPMNSDFSVSPDNLAYVIYTSGSTGKPKGALLQHRGICNLVNWQKEAFLINRESRILQFSPLSFDASVWEIFMALANGAVLCLTTQEVLADGLSLLSLLMDKEITLITLPPSVLAVLGGLPGLSVRDLDLVSIDALPALKTVIAAGEACTNEIVRRWSPGRKFFNAYGPTEATVCVSAGLCTETDLLAPSIGRPISNTHLYVLDSNHQVLPLGVPGELYIGGVGVGRGYLRRPEINAEKFTSNPLYEYLISEGQEELADERLFRTGDLVRYRPDGDLEFLGRIDQQVKLRGFRIELGEIEAILRQYGRNLINGHSLIRDVAVVIHEIETGHKRLVAFLVSEELSVPDLRNYLQSLLPEYMIPWRFISIDALPLNPSGKVDRDKLAHSSLPDLHRSHPDGLLSTKAGLEYQRNELERRISPRTPEEEILVNLFSQTLRISPVGVYDNFFELGGHSLLATQLIARLRELFQIDIPLRVVFEAPTPAELAEIVRNKVSSGLQPSQSTERLKLSIPALERDPLTGTPLTPPVLSFAQQRLWFLEQFDPGTPNYNIPTILRLNGDLDVSALEMSLNEIVRRHEVLRTSFTIRHGMAVQIIHPELFVQINMEDLSSLAVTAVNPNEALDQPVAYDRKVIEVKALSLAADEARQPFDISSAPLFRVKLIRMMAEEWLVIFCMHHLVSDGWSMGVMIHELSILYPAMRLKQLVPTKEGLAVDTREALPLPRLSIQYADFAAWQREWLQGEILGEQLAYWMAQLSDAPPVLHLPADRPRPMIPTMRGGQVQFDIEVRLAEKLDAISREAGVTLFMTLLGAFQVLLMNLSGQQDICVGTPIAGRVHGDIEDLIGFFVNTLVMRTRFQDNPSFYSVLARVREIALGAYAHQDLPFEMLVNELNPVREPAHSPLFQVMFVMQNVPFEKLNLPELAITILEFETGISRFDLTLTMAGNGQVLSGAFEYSLDLFDQATIEGLVETWKNLLSQLVAYPDIPVDQIEISGFGAWRKTDQPAQLSMTNNVIEPASQDLPLLSVTPRTIEEAILVEIWSKVLGISDIGIYDNFFELGGDSILSIQVTALAGEAGLQLTPRHIFEGQTISELAGMASPIDPVIAEQGLIRGSFPLTPIEHWFFDLGLPNPSHFNQSMLFEVNQILDPALLKDTIRLLLFHHDALRSRFHKDEFGWQQAIDDLSEIIPFEQLDISGLKTLERKSTIESVSNQVQLSLNIETGPMVRVVYFNAGELDPGRLLLVAHHLVVDAISWRVLLEDFQSIYSQLVIIRNHGLKSEPRLRLKTSSYQTWAHRLADYSQSADLINELSYWTGELEKTFHEIIMRDATGDIVNSGANTNEKSHSVVSHHRSLGSDETRALLQEVSAAYSTEVQDILLAALIMAYADWYEPDQSAEINLLVSVESHGRQELWPDIDVSRSVGWFTNFYPVYLVKNPYDGPGEIIKKVRNQLRLVPQRGIGYGILRYLNPEGAEILKSLSQPQILFNYLGQVDRFFVQTSEDYLGAVPSAGSKGQTKLAGRISAENNQLDEHQQEVPIVQPGMVTFAPASESSGLPFDPNNERPYLIEINCAVVGGKFVIDWTYNEGNFTLEIIGLLAEAYQAALSKIIQHCLETLTSGQGAGDYSASDFPLAGVDQAGLAKLLSRIGQTKKKKS